MAVVLVVDDDADTCESLARFLQRSEHAPVCAADAQQAMAALLDREPDLVLLDIKMPDMDGIAFLNVVRSYLRFTTLPVIVITGIDDADLDERAMELGIKQVFHKSRLDLQALLAAINNQIDAAD